MAIGLVGSEMCIRDSLGPVQARRRGERDGSAAQRDVRQVAEALERVPERGGEAGLVLAGNVDRHRRARRGGARGQESVFLLRERF